MEHPIKRLLLLLFIYSTLFGVVDDTTTTKFTGRACAVHCNSLPVVVVVLKFPSVLLGFAEADFECWASFNSPSMLFSSVIMDRWSSPLKRTNLPRKSLPDRVDWRGKNSLENQPRYKTANARVEWPTVRMRSISWDLCGRWLIEFKTLDIRVWIAYY